MWSFLNGEGLPYDADSDCEDADPLDEPHRGKELATFAMPDLPPGFHCTIIVSGNNSAPTCCRNGTPKCTRHGRKRTFASPAGPHFHPSSAARNTWIHIRYQLFSLVDMGRPVQDYTFIVRTTTFRSHFDLWRRRATNPNRVPVFSFDKWASGSGARNVVVLPNFSGSLEWRGGRALHGGRYARLLVKRTGPIAVNEEHVRSTSGGQLQPEEWQVLPTMEGDPLSGPWKSKRGSEALVTMELYDVVLPRGFCRRISNDQPPSPSTVPSQKAESVPINFVEPTSSSSSSPYTLAPVSDLMRSDSAPKPAHYYPAATLPERTVAKCRTLFDCLFQSKLYRKSTREMVIPTDSASPPVVIVDDEHILLLFVNVRILLALTK